MPWPGFGSRCPSFGACRPPSFPPGLKATFPAICWWWPSRPRIRQRGSKKTEGQAAEALEGALAAINPEYREKRASRRLDPVRTVVLPYDELARRLDPKTRSDADVTGRVWESQFKLLPLYSRRWEELPA